MRDSKVIEISATGRRTERAGTYVDPAALADLADRINAQHESAEKAAHSALEHAVQCGELLTEAKAAVAHGEWLPWLEKNTKIPKRTAQQYMALARAKPKLAAKSATVALLTVREAIASISNQHQRLARLPEPVISKVVEKVKPDDRLKVALSQAESHQRLAEQQARDREEAERIRQKREAGDMSNASTFGVTTVPAAVLIPFEKTWTEAERVFIGVVVDAINDLVKGGTADPRRILNLFNEAGCQARGERWEA